MTNEKEQKDHMSRLFPRMSNWQPNAMKDVCVCGAANHIYCNINCGLLFNDCWPLFKNNRIGQCVRVQAVTTLNSAIAAPQTECSFVFLFFVNNSGNKFLLANAVED